MISAEVARYTVTPKPSRVEMTTHWRDQHHCSLDGQLHQHADHPSCSTFHPWPHVLSQRQQQPGGHCLESVISSSEGLEGLANCNIEG
jgi:hypothetical protein